VAGCIRQRNTSFDPRGYSRSRESLRKLLKAAAEVLGQHGLEGATIPRIAQHAGLTPGAIYRRFPDKDALLETVIIRMLERQDERLRVMLTPAMARQIPLAVFAEQLINNMLVSYRANAGLMRALRQFAQGRDHTSFYRKVTNLEMCTYQYLVDLFLVHRKEVKHPAPQMAVSFALVTLISTLIELSRNSPLSCGSFDDSQSQIGGFPLEVLDL